MVTPFTPGLAARNLPARADEFARVKVRLTANGEPVPETAVPAPRPGRGPTGGITSGAAARRAVGERIRLARESAGIEQRTLAALMGVTQAAVSRWETGLRDPGVGGLICVAGALGIPASSLLPPGGVPDA